MSLKWGILTAGGIANAFADGLQRSQTGTLVTTGARDGTRAKEFAAKWGGRSVEGYQAVLDDPEVEAVYIATPHHLHAEWTIAAAKAGKAVLCEKPFTLNLIQAERALKEVEQAGVFFMEAFMYRCSPQTRKLAELLADHAVGTVRVVDAEFSYGSSLDRINFRTDPAVGGGGLMDVGTYCTSFSILAADNAPVKRAEYFADLSRGYDSFGVGCIEFENGVRAKIASGVHLAMKNTATITGELGWIQLDDAWKSPVGTKMTLFRHGNEPEVFSLGCEGAVLYAHEADAVAASVSTKESPMMTIAETRANMALLDRLRASCGLSFAQEPTS